MSAHQVRKSPAFSRRSDTKTGLGWWGMMVYNWSRPHHSLRQALPQPQGQKSISLARPPWRSVLPIAFGPCEMCSLALSSQQAVGDNLMSLPDNEYRTASNRWLPFPLDISSL